MTAQPIDRVPAPGTIVDIALYCACGDKVTGWGEAPWHETGVQGWRDAHKDGGGHGLVTPAQSAAGRRRREAQLGPNALRDCACGKRIRWVKTEDGRSLPISADPVPGGSLLLAVSDRGLVARELGARELARMPFTPPRHQRHSDTCTARDTYRRPRA